MYTVDIYVYIYTQEVRRNAHNAQQYIQYECRRAHRYRDIIIQLVAGDVQYSRTRLRICTYFLIMASECPTSLSSSCSSSLSSTPSGGTSAAEQASSSGSVRGFPLRVSSIKLDSAKLPPSPLPHLNLPQTYTHIQKPAAIRHAHAWGFAGIRLRGMAGVSNERWRVIARTVPGTFRG